MFIDFSSLLYASLTKEVEGNQKKQTTRNYSGNKDILVSI